MSCKAAAAADKALIAGVSVFDLFEGGALAAEGKKSLAIEVTLQPRARRSPTRNSTPSRKRSSPT